MSMCAWYNNPKFADVVIEVANDLSYVKETQKIFGHRIILDQIPYFHALFNGPWFNGTIVFKEITFKSLETMIKFAYGINPIYQEIIQYPVIMIETQRFLYDQWNDKLCHIYNDYRAYVDINKRIEIVTTMEFVDMRLLFCRSDFDPVFIQHYSLDVIHYFLKHINSKTLNCPGGELVRNQYRYGLVFIWLTLHPETPYLQVKQLKEMVIKSLVHVSQHQPIKLTDYISELEYTTLLSYNHCDILKSWINEWIQEIDRIIDSKKTTGGKNFQSSFRLHMYPPDYEVIRLSKDVNFQEK